MSSETQLSSGKSREGAILAWTQENAPYGIFTTDLELRIDSWNDWLEAHSGHRRNAVTGRALDDVFPELRSGRILELFGRALKGETIVLSTALHGYLLPLDSVFRAGPFTRMQQTARISPLLLNQQVCGTIAVIEDVTQRELQSGIVRHQHERQEVLSWALAHLLRTRDTRIMVSELFPKLAAHVPMDTYLNYLLEANGDRLLLHSASGLSIEQEKEFATVELGIGLCGRCAATRTALTLDQVQDSPDVEAAPLKSLGIRALTCHPLAVGERLIGALVFADHQRDQFQQEEIEFFSTISRYVAIAIDRAITEDALGAAQKKLSAHAAELEQKISERTVRLKDTVAQLESFTYTVAHDLRAPIRAVRGYSEVLIEDYGAEIPHDARPLIGRMLRAAKMMESLIRDLLRFSRISRREVQITCLDVNQIVEDLAALYPAFSTNETIKVQRPLHAVMGNETLLRQCLSNLLDNALKFVPPGVAPRIVIRSELRVCENFVEPAALPEASAFNPPNRPPVTTSFEGPIQTPSLSDQARSSDCVRIWIEDKGIGIDPNFQEKIFGIFERAVGTAEYEGTGMGLAIVAKAMQRMGGTYGVESVSGEGSRFWLELPHGTVNESYCRSTG